MHVNREGKGVANNDQEESEDISEQSGEDPVEHDANITPLKGISPDEED